jgi:hypothetical protein
VKRSASPALGAFAIAFIGLFEDFGVHRDDGVELVFVERDARQVLGDEFAGSSAAGDKGGAKFGDTGFNDRERLFGGLRQTEHGKKEKCAPGHRIYDNTASARR